MMPSLMDFRAELMDRSRLRVEQIDVFAHVPLGGNPAAVILGGGNLHPVTMQAVAREMNLSETVFLLASDVAAATFGARIYTVRREISFAGHAAIAAAAVAVERIGITQCRGGVVQECGAGLIPIGVEGRDEQPLYRVRLPPARWMSLDWNIPTAALLLGVSAGRLRTQPIPIVATGAPWALVEVLSRADLAALDPDFKAIAIASRSACIAGIAVFAQQDADRVYLRTFAPAEGIFEDPGCGSCMGSISAYLKAEGRAFTTESRLTFYQGDEICRPGSATVHLADNKGVNFELAGCSRKAMSGDLHLDADQMQDIGQGSMTGR